MKLELNVSSIDFRNFNKNCTLDLPDHHRLGSAFVLRADCSLGAGWLAGTIAIIARQG
jgi:hypothetical protein